MTSAEFFNTEKITGNKEENMMKSLGCDPEEANKLAKTCTDAITTYDNKPAQLKYVIENSSPDQLLLLISQGFKAMSDPLIELLAEIERNKTNNHPNI